MAKFKAKRCLNSAATAQPIVDGQMLIDPNNGSISFDYTENNTNKRFTITSPTVHNPIYYGSTEPTGSGLIDGKTVWIG